MVSDKAVPDLQQSQPQVIVAKINFYRGVKAIAAFIDRTPRHTKRMLNRGLLPAKKDAAGVWVLRDCDYDADLQD